MAGRHAVHDGPRKVGKQIGQDLAGRHHAAGFVAPGEGSQQHAAHPSQQPRVADLLNEPVEAIRPLADVLEQQQRVVPWCKTVGRSCRGRQLRQRPAQQAAGDLTGDQRLGAFEHQLPHRCGHCEGGQQRRAIVRRRSTAQPPRDGGSMKGDHAAVPHHIGQQRRHVTVADQCLWRRANRPGVEGRDDLRAAVAASHREHRSHAGVLPGSEEVGGACRRGARDIALACEQVVVPLGIESERRELGDPGVELLRLERAGGRHKCHHVARAHRRRTAQRHAHANRAIWSATAWWASVASTDVSGPVGVGAGPRNRSFARRCRARACSTRA